MARKSWFALALASMLVSACNVRQFVRTEYSLQTIGPLLASNSEAISIKPQKTDHSSRVVYPIILKNTSTDQTVVLQLDKSQLTGPSFVIKPSCSAEGPHSASESLSISPGQTTRVNCKIPLVPNHQNHLSLRDTTTTLSIPVEVDDKQIGEVLFRYRTDIEDFR